MVAVTALGILNIDLDSGGAWELRKFTKYSPFSMHTVTQGATCVDINGSTSRVASSHALRLWRRRLLNEDLP